VALLKSGLGVDVLTAARQRIARVFDEFARVCVSFSGGKDSTVMLHLVMDEARARQRRVGVLFIDLEAQYRLTIEHTAALFAEYAPWIDPYWVALPLNLRNAVSVFEPQWRCWEPADRDNWVREPHESSITAPPPDWPWFRSGMEFEEFVPAFAHWYSQGALTATLVGIRTQESLNRWRTIARANKTRWNGLPWTTWLGGVAPSVYNAYPIYDWQTEDVWRYHAHYPERRHNRLYDLMHGAGLTIHQQRICQPYGDDQRRGLWLYHVIEPETWGRVVARVAGANQGALYVQERGNVMGNHRVTLPPGHTWESFVELLLSTMPHATAEHYRMKIGVFLRWWAKKGVAEIPDEADAKDEAGRKAPSWRRIAKAILRNDYWCKGLSFTQHESQSYERYRKIMLARGLWQSRRKADHTRTPDA
jgi:predicted phosphoadenosine phosphosulfate sulfurtransferase